MFWVSRRCGQLRANLMPAAEPLSAHEPTECGCQGASVDAPSTPATTSRSRSRAWMTTASASRLPQASDHKASYSR